VASTGSRRFQLANLDVQKSDVPLGYDADGVDWARKTPCERADFALPHVIPASAGCSRTPDQKVRETEGVYPSTPMLMARASQSGAAYDQEARGFSRLQPGEAFTLPDQPWKTYDLLRKPGR
jgi:hypothetical protein